MYPRGLRRKVGSLIDEKIRKNNFVTADGKVSALIA
jgi:hypothetical protein